MARKRKKRKKELAETQVERLGGAVALAEQLLYWVQDDLQRAARDLIDKLAEALVELDLFPSYPYDWNGRPKASGDLVGRVPNFEGRGNLANDLQAELSKRLNEHAVFTATVKVWAAGQPASQELQARMAAWEIKRAEENQARAVVRHVLRSLGISTSDANDLVRRVPKRTEENERLSHFADYGGERLLFAPDNRVTFGDLWGDYQSWCNSMNVSVVDRLPKKEVGAQMIKSLVVTACRFGRAHATGYRGVGLRPQDKEQRPGVMAKRLRAEFREFLSSERFPAAMAEARKKSAEKTK